MAQALVTGAAGFIGSHVARLLLAEGSEVRALVRPGEPLANLAGLDVEIVEGDLLDALAVDRAMKGVDALFHLAAVYATWMPDWRVIWEVNLQGSRNVLWSATRAGVGRVVYTSSIAAIGVLPGRAVSDESTPFNQYALGSPYVLSKYLSQQEALGFAKNGLDLVVVNPAFPFGARDIGPTPTGRIILDLLWGRTPFLIAGGVNIVDVEDVARGHVAAAKKGRTGELYILGNRNVTLSELADLVFDAAGLPRRRLPRVPKALLKGLSVGLTAAADHVTHRQPLSTAPEVEYASKYLYVDNAKARTEFNLSFTPVEESLSRAAQWFADNGYWKR